MAMATDPALAAYRHPLLEQYWQRLDTRFPQVAEVFEEMMAEALAVIPREDFGAYLDAARYLGKLGRGPEPLLVFLEEWPSVAKVLGEEAGEGLMATMAFIREMQKSPNGRHIAAFLQTIAAVAQRLPSYELIAGYLDLARLLMHATSGSIHGRQATLASPGLPCFFAQAPKLLDVVSLAGLKNWLDYGIRHYRHHPERQAEYFSLTLPDSRAVLQRERHGLLFAAAERRLELYLRAFWNLEEPLIPYSTAFHDLRKPQPYYDRLGMRLPDLADEARGVAAIDVYRAMLAHMAGHKHWSVAQIADNWSPFQRLAVEFFEDARIDCLLMRAYPGLQRVLLALHPAPVEEACDPATTSCLRHRLAMFSRACLDPTHGYRDPVIAEFAGRVRHLLDAEGGGDTQAVARLALEFVTRTRRASDQFADVHFVDTEIPYRDDNRHLWLYIEDSDDEEFAIDPDKTPSKAIETHGLPPRHYPEWDYQTQSYRPDWASVYEALAPRGDALAIDRLLAKHEQLARKLARLLEALRPQDRIRLRYQEDGNELDLDLALRALADFRAGQAPDARIHFSHATAGRNIAVLLLLDLSESLNAVIEDSGGRQTVLELAREAVALLAWAIDRLGDPLAIAGFHSNTRHEVRYLHLKGFSERWNDEVKGRLAAIAAGYSTRMGAAMRHAGHYLAGRRADKRILLILTDGEPADVDVADPRHLLEDARRAAIELEAQGVLPYCLSLDAKADDYVRQIFSHRYRVLDRIERLPEQLPLLYLGLTR